MAAAWSATATQLLHFEAVLARVGGDHVGHQALVAGRVLAHDHDRGTHSLMCVEHSFDLTQFDSEAAQLDLVIDPTEEIELAALRA